MQKAFSTATRQPAISFVAQDRTGQPLNPDSLRGKYVLLNFWASWCVVCRKDHKILNAYFNAYHKKGLEIIGIAINDKKENWEKAIIADSTSSWHHVFDDENSGIAEEYDVEGLPVFILIDDKGKIIGRYTGANQGYYSFSSLDIFRKLYDIFKDK
jgi:thiol-disulfide isomerase/thioredoxin